MSVFINNKIQLPRRKKGIFSTPWKNFLPNYCIVKEDNYSFPQLYIHIGKIFFLGGFTEK